jgi:hypothetical protein
LPVGTLVRCNGSGHDPCESSRNVLILFRGLNACQDLLDADANLLATCHLLNLSKGTLSVTIFERAGLLQHMCEFLLRVDVWNRDLGVKAAEEVELGQNRAFGCGCEDQQAAVLHKSAGSQ